MDKPAAVLIAAVSGRALAASARRAGYRPLVTDFFGDQDTLRVAHAHVRIGGDLAKGIEADALLSALDTLSERHTPVGVVYGTGFEDRPELLRRVAERWPIFGNSADTVAAVKDPETISALVAGLNIPCPEWSMTPPAVPADWLVKRRGGSGGGHIKLATRAHKAGGQTYYQRKMPGIPVSAFFLADGRRARVLGFTEQWLGPAQRRPYRYGGAVRPATLGAPIADALAAAVHRITASMALVGLNSADFLVDGDHYWLLEINPRPGATLDLFEPSDGSLFARHMAACGGQLTGNPDALDSAKAAAIVYAKYDIASVPVVDWPDWTADRPVAGVAIKAGEPLCTVYACSSDAEGAKALAAERHETVFELMGARKS